jgi:hypothetical protein
MDTNQLGKQAIRLDYPALTGRNEKTTAAQPCAAVV